MDSLFSFIKSYIPSPSRDPQEDYLTQIFAWMLQHVPQLGSRFCQYLLEHVDQPVFQMSDDDDVRVETQVVVPAGRIDMLLRVGDHGFICEHKVGSELSDRQIERYTHAFHERTGRFYSVLITAHHLQHTQDADIRLVWADVYDFMLSVRSHYTDEHGFVIDHFVAFLRQQGLGRMEPIGTEHILGYWPGRQLPGKLEVLFQQLVQMPWSEMCPHLPDLCHNTFKPYIRKPAKWGRLGIDFFSEWRPIGMFAGVLLDFNDHKIKPVDPRQGPDLVIFLEGNYRADPEAEVDRDLWVTRMQEREAYLAHQNFQTVCARLALDSGAFSFTSVVPQSPWRIIALQQPLISVLHGTHHAQEQRDHLYEAICAGVNLITQDGLLGDIPLKV